MVIFCKHLGVISFVFFFFKFIFLASGKLLYNVVLVSAIQQCESWSGDNIPLNSHQNKWYSLISMGQVPQHNFHPPRSRPGWQEGVPVGTGYPAPNRLPSTQSGSSRQRPGLAEEANFSWQVPQVQVPRPAEPPLLREPSAQDPTGLRILRLPSGGWSQRRPLPLGHWGRNGGRGSSPPQGLDPASGWPWWGLWTPQDTSPNLFLGSLAAQGWDSPLTSLFVWGPPLWRPLTECSTNGRSRAVAGLGEGPAAAPTNGWKTISTLEEIIGW